MSDYYSDDFEDDEPTPRATPPPKPAPTKAKPAPTKASTKAPAKAPAPAAAAKKPAPARGPSGVGAKGSSAAAGAGAGKKAAVANKPAPKPAPPPKEPDSDDELESFLNELSDSDEGESMQDLLQKRRDGAEAMAKQRVADRAAGIEPRRLKSKEEWEAEKKKKEKREKERSELKKRRAAAGEGGHKTTLKEERAKLRAEKEGGYIDKLLGKMVRELENEFDGGIMASAHIIDLVLDDVVKKGELELMLRAMEEQQDAIDREARAFAEGAFKSDDWQSGVRDGVYAREAYKRRENRVDALDRFDADDALYGHLSPSKSPVPQAAMVDSLDGEFAGLGGSGSGGDYSGVKHYDDSLDQAAQRVSSNMGRYVHL